MAGTCATGRVPDFLGVPLLRLRVLGRSESRLEGWTAFRCVTGDGATWPRCRGPRLTDAPVLGVLPRRQQPPGAPRAWKQACWLPEVPGDALELDSGFLGERRAQGGRPAAPAELCVQPVSGAWVPVCRHSDWARRLYGSHCSLSLSVTNLRNQGFSALLGSIREYFQVCGQTEWAVCAVSCPPPCWALGFAGQCSERLPFWPDSLRPLPWTVPTRRLSPQGRGT